MIPNNLNPTWQLAKIPIRSLCGSTLDTDRPLRVTCWDWDSDGSHDFIGAFTTTVSDLITPTPAHWRGGRREWTLQRQRTWKSTLKGKTGYKSGGTIITKPTAFGDGVFGPFPLIEHIPTPPSILDFILGGCEIGLSIAIDFTGSNGRFEDPTSLHHIADPSASYRAARGGPVACRPKNQYEKALQAVGTILAPYDHDGEIPVFGYGARVNGAGRASHCFPLNVACTPSSSDPNVNGVDGILAAYDDAVTGGNIQLSGPTNFQEVIDTATVLAIGDGKAPLITDDYLLACLLTTFTYLLTYLLTSSTTSR